MNVITTLKEKRKEKQITYERKMLRELSLEGLKRKVNELFSEFLQTRAVFQTTLEDGCVDVAIEAYLLGAKFSKFGYYGENAVHVKQRCSRELKYFTDSLFDYFLYWGNIGDSDFVNESLYYTCEYFVDYWWSEGFQKGEKRYRLRLH